MFRPVRFFSPTAKGIPAEDDKPSNECVVSSQEWGLLPKSKNCQKCGGAFTLKKREGGSGKPFYFWRGPRPRAGRANAGARCDCYDAARSLGGGGEGFAGVAQQVNYVAFLDVLVMHLNEYPKKIIYREVVRHGVNHATVDGWVGYVQLEMTKWAQR